MALALYWILETQFIAPDLNLIFPPFFFSFFFPVSGEGTRRQRHGAGLDASRLVVSHIDCSVTHQD